MTTHQECAFFSSTDDMKTATASPATTAKAFDPRSPNVDRSPIPGLEAAIMRKQAHAKMAVNISLHVHPKS